MGAVAVKMALCQITVLIVIRKIKIRSLLIIASVFFLNYYCILLKASIDVITPG